MQLEDECVKRCQQKIKQLHSCGTCLGWAGGKNVMLMLSSRWKGMSSIEEVAEWPALSDSTKITGTGLELWQGKTKRKGGLTHEALHLL